eukprot:COSAG01_NODE_31550_length_595_cov_3.495968_1_plen_98_part_10
MHKPNDQTVVLWRGVSGLLRGLPLGKIKGLGGKVRACTISAPPRLGGGMPRWRAYPLLYRGCLSDCGRPSACADNWCVCVCLVTSADPSSVLSVASPS